MRKTLGLVCCIFLYVSCSAKSSTDTLRWHTPFVLKLNLLGPNYYGYSSGQNYSGSISLEANQFSPRQTVGFFQAVGIGMIPLYTVGHVSLGAGFIVGKNHFYFRTGATISVAYSDHIVHWNFGSQGGGSLTLKWGAQWIPQAGISYINHEKRVHVDIYAAPHFILNTYDIPGPPEDNGYWFPFGFSIGLILK